ncbi:ABC transporter permease [Mucilaginibacter puniceus]
MIKNYIKIAWRNLVRNKVQAIINLAGLSVGLACSLLIMLWVQSERSVDGFHKNGKQLYQVYERTINDGKVEASYLTQGLLATELKKQIPEIQYASGLEQNFPQTFEANKKVLKMDGTYAGADFFKMFTYQLLQGNSQTALDIPEGIAVSHKMAELFFGSPEKAIGKTIRYENRDNLTITAVFENVPANSSQQFDFLRSWRSFVAENAWVSTWDSTSPATYIQLRADADLTKVGNKIKNFVQQHKPELSNELFLQPYTEKYLHSTFKNGQIDGGRIEYVRLYSIVAIFILLIACINFMNLATARSIKRAKEVGVRKVIGAIRSALMGQFICEAMLLTFISMLFALALVLAILPAFNNVVGKQLFIPVQQPGFWAALLVLFTLTGFIAGSYPAFFLSSLNPIRVLKGSLTFTSGAKFFRKSLVVFQFTLAVFLIAGTVMIYRQMQYIHTKNIGYNRDNLLYIPLEGDLTKNYTAFKNEAIKIPGIQFISKMKESPTVITHSKGDIRWEGKDPGSNSSIADATVGYDFVKTLQLQLKEGRDFSTVYADSASFLINETAAEKMGYKEPLGKAIWWGDKKGKIVGVLRDFHYKSMHQAIEPMVIRFADDQRWGNIIIRVEEGKTQSVIAGLQKLCKQLNPNFSFSYQFSDQEYTKLYKSEQLAGNLAKYFAFLAIFISCMGLLGLAMFVAEQRFKEIGIRKILGANVSSLFALLSSEFLWLIIIALVIATPIAWYAINNWLQGFAYHTPLQWWIFALSGGLIIFIAMATVSLQLIKAALTNPVKSLRSE